MRQCGRKKVHLKAYVCLTQTAWGSRIGKIIYEASATNLKSLKEIFWYLAQLVLNAYALF